MQAHFAIQIKMLKRTTGITQPGLYTLVLSTHVSEQPRVQYLLPY